MKRSIGLGHDNLCCQCGMCNSVCSNISLAKSSNIANQDYFPAIKDPSLCSKCTTKNCLKCCPLVDNSQNLKKWIGPQIDEKSSTGPISKILIAHSKDLDIAQKASSGGIVTTLVKYLLETKKATGAILVSSKNTDEKIPHFSKIREVNELNKTSASVYSPIPLNNIVEEIINSKDDERLVFVGRPCQIRSLNKAEKLHPSLKKKIILKISLFCAFQISSDGVSFLSKLAGVKKEDKINRVEFRKGSWPGRLTFQTKENKKYIYSPTKVHTNGTYYFPLMTPFVPKACRKCFDVLGNTADVSVGDPWNLGIKPTKNYGHSLVVVRTSRADLIFNDKIFNDFYIDIDQKLTEDDLKKSQGGTIRIKRTGILLENWKFHPNNASFNRSNLMNNIYSKIVRNAPLSMIPNSVFDYYLQLAWHMIKKNREAETADL